MACFGSPKFDRREPLHILSADSRFPDVEPRRIRKVGNHFLALFPVNTLKHGADHHNQQQQQQQRFRRHALIRGGSRIEGNKNREKVSSRSSGDDNDGRSTGSGKDTNKRNNNGSWTSKVMDWFVIEDNDHGMSFDSNQHNRRGGMKARALLLQLLGDFYWGFLGGCL